MIKFTPSIIITGPSGSGKSMCFRSMPQNETLMIDLELKGMPFAWKHPETLVQPKSWADFVAALKAGIANPAIKYIAIDSLTAALMHLRELQLKNFAGDKNGFAAWRAYNLGVWSLLSEIKLGGKTVICTSLEELVQIQGIDGTVITRRRAYVDGREWANKGIESEFLAAWATSPKFENGAAVYKLATQTNGITLAKTPPSWKLPPEIPNDAFAAIKKAEEAFATA